MTPQATCSKLGSKSYIHPHTAPKTTVIHTPYGSKSPKYADSLAGERGEDPHRKGQEEREQGAAGTEERGGTRESRRKGLQKREVVKGELRGRKK